MISAAYDDEGVSADPSTPWNDAAGRAERSHRTHTQEFYEGTTAALTVAALATQLLAWETVYNTVRPHQALAQLTPLEYLTTPQEAV